MPTISIEEAYQEACVALGEVTVRERLLGRILGRMESESEMAAQDAASQDGPPEHAEDPESGDPEEKPEAPVDPDAPVSTLEALGEGGKYAHLVVNLFETGEGRQSPVEVSEGTTFNLIEVEVDGKTVYSMDFDGNETGSLDAAYEVDPHNLMLRTFRLIREAK